MLTILYRASFAAALLLEISDYFHGKEKKPTAYASLFLKCLPLLH